jgi:hypothetical protein
MLDIVVEWITPMLRILKVPRLNLYSEVFVALHSPSGQVPHSPITQHSTLLIASSDEPCMITTQSSCCLFTCLLCSPEVSFIVSTRK